MNGAPVDCARCRELAPELALGTAEGGERAAALEHLAWCEACRRELAELAAAADSLLLLGPSVEPPAGFETQALAAFRGGADLGGRARPSRARPVLTAAAAALVVAVGMAVGLRLTTEGSGGRSTKTTEEAIGADRSAVVRTPGGASVGRVTVHEGARASLEVRLAGGAPAGTYVVHCDYEAGPAYRAGTLVAGPGATGPWRATVDVPVYDLRRVRLESTTGGPNLEAELPT
ncbi:hypothetical protein BH10ACT1_BH10ACT1_33760 [soil metagenome]